MQPAPFPRFDKRWRIAPRLSQEDELELMAFPPLMRQILYNRGYRTYQAACAYLDAQVPDGCDHRSMLGIAAAVDRIEYAIQKHEPITIYGDYDADGVTATALLKQALERLGANSLGYIPNRFEEGYGLNIEALDGLAEEGVRLVITVDCGIRSPGEAEHARQIGLDLIITDHHVPGDELPLAHSVINPKQPGDTYPDKQLAGVGLAYKLACGLFEKTNRQPPLQEYLDLVALGTITDLVPLTGENRALVRLGLESIRRPQRQGVMSLLGVSGIAPLQVNSEHVSFGLGPRLNAAGRLESAMAALNLLLTRDVNEAGHLAQLLDNQNRERQNLTREIQAHAEQIALADDPHGLLLFAVDESYNSGVIGLAASRLTEQYYRPAIVAARGEEFTRGSCRSIPEFHITEALDQCADLLVKHGGHAVAAGFTVSNRDLPELIRRLKEIARQKLGEVDLCPTLSADAEIPLREVRPDLIPELARLQPTGQENAMPVFVSRGLKVTRSQTVGKEKNHLKLTVTDGKITYDAIAFRLGHLYGQLPPYVDLMYAYETNEYNGRVSLQLNVKDLKPAQAV